MSATQQDVMKTKAKCLASLYLAIQTADRAREQDEKPNSSRYDDSAAQIAVQVVAETIDTAIDNGVTYEEILQLLGSR